METTLKPNGNESGVGIESRGSEVRVAKLKSVKYSELFLRFLALVTTLVAIIVFGVSKQTKTVPVTVFPNLPPINIEASAKWQYLSAFVYFMVINIIACVYAALSLVLSIANRVGSKGLGLTLVVLDLVMVGLLFSANGAAAAVGVIGYKGNSHVRWNKVCDVFGYFCNHVAASIVLSLIGSLIFVVLIVLATLHLHKKSH